MDATVILAEHFEQSGRKHHVTILPPFAVLDVNDHSLAVDRGRRQFNGLGDSQTGRIANGQYHPVFQVLDGIETPAGLVGAHHYRQRSRLAAGRHDLFEPPIALERDVVEKSDR